MDKEFSDLIPVFLEEARDRLDRLATRVPAMDDDKDALVVVKRELHTLKGSARMLQLGAMAELCHAAEDALADARPQRVALLVEAVDRLNAMLDGLAAGDEPGPADELIARLRGTADDRTSPSGKAPSREPQPPASADTQPPASAKPQPPISPDPQPPIGPEPQPPIGPEPQPPISPEPQPPISPEPVEGRGTDEDTPADAELRIDVDAPLGAEPPAPSAATDPPAAAQPAAGLLSAPEIRVDAASLDEVADRATQLRLMALGASHVGDRIYELAHLAEDGLHEPQPRQVLAVLSTMLRRMAVELEGDQRLMLRAAEGQLERVLALQLQPLRGTLLSMARYARQIAASLGREVEVQIEGQETRLDRRIARDLEDSLIHLVRNAVDHGMEGSSERQEAGKPRAGRLRLKASTSGSRVRLEIRDDGPGIAPAEIVDQAVALGLVERSAAAGLRREEAFRLLFAPGFSTRRKVSELSGRGVGLDVVAGAVTRVGGEVFLRSEPGRGTTVAIEVPVARRGEQVMVLHVGATKIALPSSVVRAATEITDADVVERGGRTLAKVADRLVPFVSLGAVYGEPPADTQLLLEGSVSGQRLAVTVDDVDGEEEVLVRPLPTVLAGDRLLEGIALLSSGEPVGVLSPAALARRDLLRARPRAVAAPAPRRVRVLLVDDSLVTREMERRLLEDAGFSVVAAGDADEALGCLGEESFDCIVTDIEMPGMDGFALTEHLRSMEHFAQLPIVVVSTRDRPEDRLRGLRAGADAYLTKQGLDAGELIDLVRRLAGR